MAGRKMGRRTALTPEVQEKVVQAIRAGNYMEQAAQYAGIHKSTLYRWLAQADEPDAPAAVRDFRDAIKDAEAAAEVHAVAMVRSAMPTNWQAAMTFLERRHPERWRRRDVRELTGPEGGPVQVERSLGIPDDASPDDLADLADRLRERREDVPRRAAR